MHTVAVVFKHNAVLVVLFRKKKWESQLHCFCTECNSFFLSRRTKSLNSKKKPRLSQERKDISAESINEKDFEYTLVGKNSLLTRHGFLHSSTLSWLPTITCGGGEGRGWGGRQASPLSHFSQECGHIQTGRAHAQPPPPATK